MDFLKSKRGTLAITIKSIILACLFFTISVQAQAADTIKVGVLHSLSGTMAISETSLKDVALMAIDEINANGGVLGKKLEQLEGELAEVRGQMSQRLQELCG